MRFFYNNSRGFVPNMVGWIFSKDLISYKEHSLKPYQQVRLKWVARIYLQAFNEKNLRIAHDNGWTVQLSNGDVYWCGWIRKLYWWEY